MDCPPTTTDAPDEPSCAPALGPAPASPPRLERPPSPAVSAASAPLPPPSTLLSEPSSGVKPPPSPSYSVVKSELAVPDPDAPSDLLLVAKQRQVTFTVVMKQQAVLWIMGPGKGNIRRAVKHFRDLNWEVNLDMLQKWWKGRHRILQGGGGSAMAAATALAALPSPTSCSTATTAVSTSSSSPPRYTLLSPEQEKNLADVIRRRAAKVRVSPKWIVMAVRQMFPDKAHRKFRASKTWLLGFTHRHGLRLVGAMVVADEGCTFITNTTITPANAEDDTKMKLEIDTGLRPAVVTIAA